jgi:hypothetical protein
MKLALEAEARRNLERALPAAAEYLIYASRRLAKSQWLGLPRRHQRVQCFSITFEVGDIKDVKDLADELELDPLAKLDCPRDAQVGGKGG